MTHALRISLLALSCCLLADHALGQDAEPIRLTGVLIAGSRTSVTESWGTVYFTVENPNSAPREARVLLFYANQKDIQFGRDIWIPAKASITAWLPIGPAPAQSGQFGRELQMLLYDRTGGQERLILPSGDERVRSRPLVYKTRQATTALYVDPPEDNPMPGVRADTPATQALLMTHVLRQTAGLPEHVSVVSDGLLPPTPEVFEGVDHVVLASNRLAADPTGRAVLRRWVEQGGRLWVMLDLVDPAVIAPILGDDADFQVVDRVGLTSVSVRRQKDDALVSAAREFEKPVDLVRLVPGASDQVQHTVNGWPASFVRSLGRGRIVFTTLGASAWHRPRTPQDSASNYEKHPELPIALVPLEELSAELRPKGGSTALSPDDLLPLLTEEIGYQIVDRRTAGLILGAFVVALVALGVGLRRSRRPELAGWIAPVAAVGASALFLILGESSRRAVPPTVAVAEIVDVVSGSGESAVSGVFAVYHPTSGLAPIATRHGAALDLDAEGLEGQARRRIQTDLANWHWENLALPAGVRTGPFRAAVRSPDLMANARFGPSGLEGRIVAGGFRDIGDALVSSVGKEFVAVRASPDGSFAAGPDDMLPPGQFLSGTVLSDRQQRRQTVIRKLLGGKLPDHMEGRDILLAWAEPAELPFTATEGARAIGTALLLVPLEIERPAAGTRVVVPRAFVSVRRVADGALRTPTLDAASSAEQHLRFQLPPSVLPMTVERATLFLKARAPTRRLTVSGLVNGKLVELFQVTSPAEPIRLVIDDQRFLSVDDKGGLNLMVTVGEPGGSAEDTRWSIEAIGLEVIGKTADR